MDPDDPVCLCFHVTRRKVIRYIRVEKPRRASQLSECFGAGTGCGWCRPYLARLLATHGSSDSQPESAQPEAGTPPLGDLDELTMEDYQSARARYRKARQTPSEDDAAD